MITSRTVSGASGIHCIVALFVAGLAVGCTSRNSEDAHPTTTCPAGYTDCGGQCVNLESDAANCGACDKSCPTGTVCANGACSAGACPAGTLQCGASCVDSATDALNCGACGTECTGGATCSNGFCIGSTGTGGTGSGGAGSGGTAGMCSNGSCMGGTDGGGTAGILLNATCPGDAANAYQGDPGQVPGTIEAENFDPSGYSDSSTGNEGGAYRTDVDVDIKTLGAGYAIGWMTVGEWLEYTVDVPTAGTYTLSVRAGAVDAGRTLEFSACGAVLASVTIPQISAWGEMATAPPVTVELEAGLQVLRVTVGASDYLDFDSFTLTEGGTGIIACSTGTGQPGDVTVSLSSVQQKISGFGVSSAWAGDFRDPVNDPDMLWSTTKGAGLTLHRIRIGGGTTSETSIAKKAVEYGVKVWATPWEVDTAMTDRSLCPTNDPCDPPPKLVDPQGWANELAQFVATMEAAGVPIYAISAENEPDSGGMNHTVSFTATELADWVGNYLERQTV